MLFPEIEEVKHSKVKFFKVSLELLSLYYNLY